MTNEDSPVITEVDGCIAVVRFSRPDLRNPLSLATLRELERTTSSLFTCDDIEAVIFTGTDGVFASGANIRELARLDFATALEFSRVGQDLFQTIANASQVTIAAINGYCIGGGLDLALSCDIRIASKSAVFSHPGARLGIITGWGGTQRLPRIVGRARAVELFTTARRFTADEALALGLVSEMADPILERAMQMSGKAVQKKAPDKSPTPCK